MSDIPEIDLAAILVAGASAVVAAFSWARAGRAAKAAERSADEAATANLIARESLEFQQKEAEAREDRLLSAKRATVVAIRWTGSNSATYKGLNVKNEGPGLASNIRGYVGYPNGKFNVTIEYPSISAGETVGILGWQSDEAMPAAIVGMPAVPQRQIALRVLWQNEDGSRGDSAWRVVSETL